MSTELFDYLDNQARKKIHITEIKDLVSSKQEFQDMIEENPEIAELGSLDKDSGWFEYHEEIYSPRIEKKFKQEFKDQVWPKIQVTLLGCLLLILTLLIPLPALVNSIMATGSVFIIWVFGAWALGSAISLWRERSGAASGSALIGNFTTIF